MKVLKARELLTKHQNPLSERLTTMRHDLDMLLRLERGAFVQTREVPAYNQFPPLEDEFLRVNAAVCPWALAGLTAGGGFGSQPGDANHPGILAINNGNVANGGGRVILLQTALILGGGETTEFVFNIPNTTALLAYLGLHDSGAAAAPVDGAWINIAAAVLTGKTSDNSVVSTTASSYAISTETWYRAKTEVNYNATEVDFYLYDEAGTLLWSDSLTTNIPTARTTGHGVVAYKTTAPNVWLIQLDYMNLYITRKLVR